jgi:hypothetical protein
MQALVPGRLRFISAAITASTLASTAVVAAAPAPPAASALPAALPAVVPPAYESGPVTPEPALPPVSHPDRDERMERARFSGRRMVVELLAGAAVGSLVAYATFDSLCDGTNDCFGASLASAGANFAVTPLVTWGVGRWMGGQGTLGFTYLGGSAALGAFAATGSADESPSEALARIKLELAISTVLLPVTSALIFELSSHAGYTRWRTAVQAGHLSIGITPTLARRGVDGAMARVSFRF